MFSTLGSPIKSALARALAGGVLAAASLAAQAQTLRVMPVGDSITSGYQSTDNNGYRAALRGLLQGEVEGLDFVGTVKDGTMADHDHEGHSGWRIEQVTNIITGSLQRYHPNVITLHLGTNDMGQGYQINTAPQRLATLIDKIFAVEPDVSIVVAQIIRPDNSTNDARTLAFNQQIPALVQARAHAGKHIVMVDMAAALTFSDLKDRLHPNDGGYRKMAPVWNNGIRQVIANGWIKAPTPISTRLIGYQSVKCLDVPGGSQADETLVSLYGCNGGSNQEWKLQPNGEVQVYGGKCLDALRQSTTPGSVVGIYTCNGGGNQQWRLKPDGSLVGAQSGLCLDVNGGATGNGAKVTLWTCNGGPNQKWAQGD